MENLSERKSTDYEAVLYLYTASQIIPLNYIWSNILICQFNKLQNTKSDKNQLSETELNEFNKLKSWIFSKQISTKIKNNTRINTSLDL